MRRLLVALAALATLAVTGGAAHAQPAPVLDVTVSTDQAAYTPGQPVAITVTAVNRAAESITLSFRSGQVYDFAIVPEGATAPVWRWSTGRSFTQSFVFRTIEPGETLTYTERWTQTDDAGKQVPTGVYQAIGEIVGGSRFSAATTFVIGEEQAVAGPGCSDLVARHGTGVPPAQFARAFSPAGVVQSIWKQVGESWLGWGADSAQPNNLQSVTTGDHIRVCLSAPARWTVPDQAN